ncbi:hypothetical protein [Kitasatospora sp. NPDC051914]|uniref:hypothetical protein n=1 Tax=Kitasatospora sp. NPDC051914 TaxID=3154945 RepID=UPI00342A579D
MNDKKSALRRVPSRTALVFYTAVPIWFLLDEIYEPSSWHLVKLVLFSAWTTAAAAAFALSFRRKEN